MAGPTHEDNDEQAPDRPPPPRRALKYIPSPPKYPASQNGNYDPPPYDPNISMPPPKYPSGTPTEAPSLPELPGVEPPEPADPKDILSLPRKLALAVGAAPLVFPIVTATVFVTLFLLETASLSARNVSVVLFVARAFDAISDPIVGILVNKTQRKKNTLRRWMMAALPVLIGSYFALWQTMDVDEWVRVTYYTLVYIVLQVAFTVYSVPYSALIMYQTNNRRERDVITAFRMTAEILFGVVAVGVMGLITGDAASDECGKEDDLKMKYVISATVIVGIVFVAGIVTFFGTRERKDIRTTTTKTPIWTATKQVLSHKPYVYLMLSYFCMFLAVSIVQGNLQLYFKYSLGEKIVHSEDGTTTAAQSKGNEFTIAVIILMLTGGLGVPLWQMVLTKFGKKKAVYLGVLMIVPSLTSLAFVPRDLNQYVIYCLCFVAGFGIGSGYFLPWSMLPDVVDDYIVKYNESSESIFYGFFVFFNKFAAGIGLAVSAIFLEIAEYTNDACADQPDAVDLTLRLLCAPGPAFMVLCYALFVYLYPLNEEKCQENKQILMERKKRQRAMKEHNEQHVNPAYNYLPEYISAL